MIVKKTILTILIAVCVFSTLVLPMTPINKVALALALLFFLIFSGKYIISSLAPFIIIGIFLYGFLLSVIFGNCDSDLARQFLLSSFLLLLVFPIMNYEINFDKIIKIGGWILIICDLLFVLYAADKHSIHLLFNMEVIAPYVTRFIPTQLIETIEKYSETAVGIRGFFGEGSGMIHLGTIPFLYLPICLWFNDFLDTHKLRRLIPIVISVILIIISTSRALLLLSVIMCACLFVIHANTFLGKTFRFLLVAGIGIGAVIYIAFNSTVFSPTEESNLVKIGHIFSAFSDMDVFQALFGRGLGSLYYSSGLGKVIAHTEITLLDYFRYVGIPLALTIYFQLLCPSLDRIGKVSGIGGSIFAFNLILFGYLVISLTNPVLINSMGFLVIIWYWTKILPPDRKIEISELQTQRDFSFCSKVPSCEKTCQ